MKKIVLGLLAVIIIVVLGVSLFLDSIVKKAIEEGGTHVLKVPVTVESVNISVFSGSGSVKGLKIANPQGHKDPYAIELGEAGFEVALSSLSSGTIIVKKILIDGPKIVYDSSLSGSNISKIQKNVAQSSNEKQKETSANEETTSAKDGGEGKKVVIEDLMIDNGKIKIAIAGAGKEIPLPQIHLKDLGKEKDGETGVGFAQALNEIFSAILTSVTSAIGSSGSLLGDTGKSAAEAVGEAVEGLKGMLK